MLELSKPPTSNLVLSEYKYLVYVLEEAKHLRDSPNSPPGPFKTRLCQFINDCANAVCTHICRHNQDMHGIKNEGTHSQPHPQVLLDKYKDIIQFTGINFEPLSEAKSNEKFNEEEYQKNLKKLIEMYERKELLIKNNNLSQEFVQSIKNLELVIEKQLEMKNKMVPIKKKPAASSSKSSPTKSTSKPATSTKKPATKKAASPST